ncbi:allantoate deiminase [Virgibacillus sp. NKC19-3]|uniref:allantoate deiminase n=1 Tax=Virgibacillus saliphilus TaxID=2831674 RepID=UPI001C9B1D5E|nr:allantoate deiminase [Virgibacillus sp. NKC19-3]MBY7144220.1 allantoate deiminase [Virgibacillus sp. NKC19-3]
MVSSTNSNAGEAIEDKLQWLGKIAADPKGGISRLLYSPEWAETQRVLKQLFEEEGFSTGYDEVGNLFGRLEGTKYKDETVLTGSHIDSVINGGIYDGQYGVITGYFALKYLQENYGPPLRNIEVVSMAEEEGSRFSYTCWGSKNIVGLAKTEDVSALKDADSVSFDEAIRAAGFDYKKNPEAAREDIKSFIEVHVEQGNVLETEGKAVGVVQYIVGQRRFTITVNGQANHAGTTPMGYRKDAMNAVSRMSYAINDLALAYGDPLIATVGSIALEPNTPNVIPGKAIFSLDVRHTNKDALVKFTNEIKAEINEIAKLLGVEVDIDMYMDAEPVTMDKTIVKTIEEQCHKSNLNYKMMHSGAGHDAQIIAPVVPTAMIFVPSHNGISHSPSEYTETKDLGEGLHTLIGTLYELGYKE